MHPTPDPDLSLSLHANEMVEAAPCERDPPLVDQLRPTFVYHVTRPSHPSHPMPFPPLFIHCTPLAPTKALITFLRCGWDGRGYLMERALRQGEKLGHHIQQRPHPSLKHASDQHPTSNISLRPPRLVPPRIVGSAVHLPEGPSLLSSGGQCDYLTTSHG